MMRGATALSAVLYNARLRSPLERVSDHAWARFADALTIDDDAGPNNGKPRWFSARTHAGGLGCFGILPRRLVDIGFAKMARVIDGRTVAVGLVRGFLVNPLAQRDALNASIQRYDADLDKTVLLLPSEISRSGALALYHRLGPDALAKWQKHKQQSTEALFRRANELF
jgi:hypothetical protein